MDVKLTLKLDRTAIEAAKLYAEQRGTSLSRVVEGYFRHLAGTSRPGDASPKGIVAELAGALKGLEIGDHRDEYTAYLMRKYS